MCQCALLVSAGDGTISQEEIGEVGEVKAFLGMLIRNREAIEALDQSGDIEQAKELRGDMVLMHEMDLFRATRCRDARRPPRPKQSPQQERTKQVRRGACR